MTMHFDVAPATPAPDPPPPTEASKAPSDRSTTFQPVEGGSVVGTGEYSEGEEVQLTAVPNAGFEFVFWIEGGVFFSGQSTISFTADAPRQLQANFLPSADEVFISGFEG